MEAQAVVAIILVTGMSASVIGILGTTLGNDVGDLDLQPLEGVQSARRRTKHFKNAMEIVEVLAYHAVRVAKSAHAHLGTNSTPTLHCRLEQEIVDSVLPRETQGIDVCIDHLSLCVLVELKFRDLWAVLGPPEVGNLTNKVWEQTPSMQLTQQESVGRGADHQLNLGVQLGLNVRVKGDGQVGLHDDARWQLKAVLIRSSGLWFLDLGEWMDDQLGVIH